jgi:uncharacterized protein involved in exopolysaccharide biosynthesis
MDEPEIRITNIKGIIRRRKRVFIVVSLLISLLIGSVAFMLPPIYKSEARLRIEGQQISEEYVKSTFTSYVEERLQLITDKVLSRKNLAMLIAKYDLYPKAQEKLRPEELFVKMRDDINLTTEAVDTMDRKTGRAISATFAFTLSYEGKDPEKVHQVARDLTDLYVKEHSKTREKRATTTTEFFQKELNQIREEIQGFESRISQFKRDHIGELPENATLNLQRLAVLERELDQAEMLIRSLQERKMYLEGQLYSLEPLWAEDDEVDPEEYLTRIRLRLINLQTTRTEKHPDVIRLKKEISELEDQLERMDDMVALAKRLKELEGQVTVLKGRLEPGHPDVIELTKEVALLSKELNAKRGNVEWRRFAEQTPDNPAYVNVKIQIANVEAEIESAIKRKAEIKRSITEYQEKIGKTPLVEKEYNELTRDYEAAKQRYNEIKNKLMEAKVAEEMEQTQRGERFSLIDPPQLPEKPFKPERMAIVVVGFLLALGGGAGLAWALEYLDSSIKTADDISAITKVPVFSPIPLVVTEGERRSRPLRGAMWLVVGIGVIFGVALLTDHYVMPLDALWEKIQSKFTVIELPI